MNRFNIIIPVYNEGNNLKFLIPYILSLNINNLEKIYIVDSNSTDNTYQIINSFMRKFPNIVYIREETRNGKSSAINKALKHIKEGIVVVHSADCLTTKESLLKLVNAIKNDVGASMLCAEPVIENNSIDEKISYYSWIISNETCYELSKMGILRHIGNDIFAFKREIIDEIKENVVNDDSYIALKITMKGFKIVFLSDAKVKIKATSNFHDYLKQRLRINYGHKVNKKITNMYSTNLKNLFFIKPNIAFKILFRSLIKYFPESFFYIPLLVFIEVISELFLLLRLYSFDFIRWPIAYSTKDIFKLNENVIKKYGRSRMEK
jgi:cellulose synthase/poly-beta-1,6-N-acetylglucosamine synthase-like glycosyltransferase